jgi:hypothetical protein
MENSFAMRIVRMIKELIFEINQPGSAKAKRAVFLVERGQQPSRPERQADRRGFFARLFGQKKKGGS